MDKKIGFIGCGNMAQAMIAGIVKSKLVEADKIIASNPSQGKLREVNEKYGIQITSSNTAVAEFADILVLSVKPDKYVTVIAEIKDFVKDDVLVVTIAAGVSINTVKEAFGKEVKVIRSMPNTPALVGAAMSALCKDNKVTEEDMSYIVSIFESFGKAEIIDEKLMDVVTAVSGSSPAYVYMFIEALADGAVLGGMKRDAAYRMAAQAVLGSAKMVLESGKHPGQLKDEVSSPGGTTIEAVYTLEKNNFRGAVISAMESCTEKSKRMSKK
ncbi:MAG: pyrroline-5-carboxylate reductase [Bacillota bacterium]|nr:pyrroline-5-carboxylate reductase [Bacillota bacterium]